MNHEALIDANDSNDDRAEASGYGRYLKQARETLGFSLDEVAIELHLAKDLIEHLEHEQLALLPDPIFVRGYIRAYAKLVQANPDKAIAAFNAVCAPAEPKKLDLSKHIVIKEVRGGGEKPIRWVSYIIFIGLVVLLLMWWHGRSGESNSTDTNTVAALATLKPVADGTTSTALPTTVSSSPVNSDNTNPTAASNEASPNTPTAGQAMTTQTSNGPAQQTQVNSPQDIVNTNVQNLAPTTATAVSTTSAAPAAASANTPATQTLSNTPTPVVAHVSTPNTAAVPVSSAPKAKKATSTWRNPDLE